MFELTIFPISGEFLNLQDICQEACLNNRVCVAGPAQQQNGVLEISLMTIFLYSFPIFAVEHQDKDFFLHRSTPNLRIDLPN